jgi:hypothetical protein
MVKSYQSYIHTIYIEKTHKFAACHHIEVCQIVETLVRFFSYSHDQEHVHTTLI